MKQINLHLKYLLQCFILLVLLFSLEGNMLAQSPCLNDNDCDGVIDAEDKDDDNDGISDIDEGYVELNICILSFKVQILIKVHLVILMELNYW